jgi:hypothetical protein
VASTIPASGSGTIYYDRSFARYGQAYGNYDPGGSYAQEFAGDTQDLFGGLFDTRNRELAQNQGRRLTPDPAHTGWNQLCGGQSLTIFNGVDANLDRNNADWAELIDKALLAHPSAAEWSNTAVCKENPNRTLNAPLALVGCLWATRRSTGSPPSTKARHTSFTNGWKEFNFNWRNHADW